MIDISIILAAMLSRPVFVDDRAEPAGLREARFLPYAEAIAEVAPSVEWAAFLIADGDEESHGARYVLEGDCLSGRWKCDPHGGRPRAQGYWQVWASACAATTPREELACVMKQARAGRARCSTWAGAFSALKSLHRMGCDWAGAARRIETMNSVRAVLYREIAKAER